LKTLVSLLDSVVSSVCFHHAIITRKHRKSCRLCGTSLYIWCFFVVLQWERIHFL